MIDGPLRQGQDDSAFHEDPKGLETLKEIYTTLNWTVPDLSEKVLVLVEGNVDWVLYGSMLRAEPGETCHIYPVKAVNENTKGKILRIMTAISENGNLLAEKSPIGIVDSDFNAVEGKERSIDGLFYTDTHDAETMVMSVGVLARLLDSMVKDGTIDREARNRVLAKTKARNLTKLIVRETYGHGILRLYLHQNRLHGPEYKSVMRLTVDLFDSGTGRIRGGLIMERVARALSGDPLRGPMSVEVLERSKRELALRHQDLESSNPWMIINGHDATTMLLILLNNGGLCPRRMYRDRFEERHINKGLLQQVTFDDVLRFKLSDGLRSWQDANKIKILVDDPKSFQKKLSKKASEQWEL